MRTPAVVRLSFLCLLGLGLTPGLLAAQTEASEESSGVTYPSLPDGVEVHAIVRWCGSSEYWVTVKQALLDTGTNFTSFHCVGNDESEQKAVAAVLNSTAPLNRTLIIASLPTRTNGSNYVPLLEGGATMFWIEAAPNITAIGLDPELTRSYLFRPSTKHGASHIAREFCRRTETLNAQDIVLLTGRDDAADYISQRAQVFKTTVEQTCGHKGHKFVRELSTDWPPEASEAAMAKLFAVQPGITAIVAVTDDLAIGAYRAAMSTRKGGTSGLLISGWNYAPEIWPLLDSADVYMTIDQQMEQPDRGTIYTMFTLAPSVMAIDDGLPPEGVPFYVETPVIPKLSDMGNYVLSNHLLPMYNPRVQPHGDLNISVGMQRVVVTEVEPNAGVCQAVFRMNITWTDARLKWDRALHDEPITLMPRQNDPIIWTPPLIFFNQESQQTTINSPLVHVEPSGRVTMRLHLAASFLISEGSLQLYPFDSHTCAVELSVATRNTKMKLVPDGTFWIDGAPDNFRLVSHEINQQVAERSEVTLLRYEMVLERYSFAFYLRLIIPAFLLNMIGFLTFWMTDPGSGLGLGITTMLCTLALKESVDLPPTSFLAWVELFMLTNTLWQGITVFLGFLEYHPAMQLMAFSWLASVWDFVRGSGWEEPLARAERRTLRRATTQVRQRVHTGKKKVQPLAQDFDAVDGEEIGAGAEAEPVMATSSREAVDNSSQDENLTVGTWERLGRIELESERVSPADVLGRYFIVPSYLVMFCLLVFGPKDLLV